MNSLEEKKEIVISNYQLSYDLDIAMMKAGLTTEEKKLCKNDQSFMFRVNYQDALIRETIIKTMVANVESFDSKLAQKAAVDLGNILWKEKFKSKDEGPKTEVPDNIVLKGKGPLE